MSVGGIARHSFFWKHFKITCVHAYGTNVGGVFNFMILSTLVSLLSNMQKFWWHWYIPIFLDVKANRDENLIESKSALIRNRALYEGEFKMQRPAFYINIIHRGHFSIPLQFTTFNAGHCLGACDILADFPTISFLLVCTWYNHQLLIHPPHFQRAAVVETSGNF